MVFPDGSRMLHWPLTSQCYDPPRGRATFREGLYSRAVKGIGKILLNRPTDRPKGSVFVQDTPLSLRNFTFKLLNMG
jgi:hypothetical protein